MSNLCSNKCHFFVVNESIGHITGMMGPIDVRQTRKYTKCIWGNYAT